MPKRSAWDYVWLGLVLFAIPAVLLALASCAAAPIGMRYANPNCIWRCNVVVVDAQGSPMLQTLTTTQTGTGGAVTRGTAVTTTETDSRTSSGPVGMQY